MPRLTRVHQKVFASNASNNGVFGSLQAGNPQTSNDVATLQSLSAFENGWDDAIEQGDKLPPLEEFQGVQYGISYQQAYMLQEGIAEWNASTTYYKGSLVKTISGSSFKLYCSLADNNTNHVVTNTTYWKLVMDSDNLYAYDSDVVHKTGNESIGGTKTFTSTISGSISGNAGTVTNGVYTTGNQTIGGTKTFSNTISGSINGNAGSATKLQTARNINGTAFNGTGNITTASWGTARNISISDSDGTNTGAAVSVNGSGAVTLKLPSTIKASISGNASTVSNGVYTNTAQTISGNKTFTGTVTLNGTVNAAAATKSDIVKWMMPNYSTITNLVNGTAGNGTYTPTKNGYIHVKATRNERQASVAVNNISVFNSDWSASYGSNDNCFIPVAKGDVITWYANRTETIYIDFFECYGG